MYACVYLGSVELQAAKLLHLHSFSANANTNTSGIAITETEVQGHYLAYVFMYS